MATRAIFTPESAEFPATNFPQLQLINRRPVLSYDAATNEAAQWTSNAPIGLTGAITVIVSYIMASATSGTIGFQGALEAITDGDSFDMDAGDSFDTVNSSSLVAVPGTAGYIDQISITMTNADNIAAGDYYRLKINRDATNDTAAGDCHVLSVELRDAA